MRIQGVDPAQVPAELTGFFAEQTRRFGRPLLSSQIMARRPSILTGLEELAKGIDASGLLPAGLPALVNRRVATHNGCPF